MNGMKRLGLLVSALVLATSAAACGDSDPAGPEGITGNYELVLVSGEAVPVLLFEQEDPEVGTIGAFLSAGTLSLTADQTFSLTLTVEARVDGDVVAENSDTESGTYELNGSTVTLTVPGTGSVTGTIDGSEITLTQTVEDAGTLSLVFRK